VIEPIAEPRLGRRTTAGAASSLFAVRDTLRAALEPGERIAGWAIAQHEPDARRAALSLSLAFVPVVGQLLAGIDMLAAIRRQRFVVLTDRRLLLLRPDRRTWTPDGAGIAADLHLGAFTLKDLDAGARWWIADDEAPPPRKTRRPRTGMRSARRRPTASVARIRLDAPPAEPWTMRIAARPDEASARLVEALRAIAASETGTPDHHAATADPPGPAAPDMLRQGATEDTEPRTT